MIRKNFTMNGKVWGVGEMPQDVLHIFAYANRAKETSGFYLC